MSFFAIPSHWKTLLKEWWKLKKDSELLQTWCNWEREVSEPVSRRMGLLLILVLERRPIQKQRSSGLISPHIRGWSKLYRIFRFILSQPGKMKKIDTFVSLQITSSSVEQNPLHYFYLLVKFLVLLSFSTILYSSEVFFERIFVTRPWKALFVSKDDDIYEWWFRWKLDRYRLASSLASFSL